MPKWGCRRIARGYRFITNVLEIACDRMQLSSRANTRRSPDLVPGATRMMSSRAYTVRARWDEVSKTWWTEGEDIPGLCCRGWMSFEELIEASPRARAGTAARQWDRAAGPGGGHYRDRRAACDGVYRRLTALLPRGRLPVASVCPQDLSLCVFFALRAASRVLR